MTEPKPDEISERSTDPISNSQSDLDDVTLQASENDEVDMPNELSIVPKQDFDSGQSDFPIF
jgi:hypothetical protein